MFTKQEIKVAEEFFDKYLEGNVDIENLSEKDKKENRAIPALFEVAFNYGRNYNKEILGTTKISFFDNELGIFCYPKNGSIDVYPDPTELLKAFLPDWFYGIEESVMLFANNEITKNLTLSTVIVAFDNLGLEINQAILYDPYNPFISVVDDYKRKNKKNIKL